MLFIKTLDDYLWHGTGCKALIVIIDKSYYFPVFLCQRYTIDLGKMICKLFGAILSIHKVTVFVQSNYPAAKRDHRSKPLESLTIAESTSSAPALQAVYSLTIPVCTAGRIQERFSLLTVIVFLSPRWPPVT